MIKINPKWEQVPSARLLGFKRTTVFVENEEPIIFMAETAESGPSLGYLVEQAEDGNWILLTFAPDFMLQAMISNQIPVRQVLTGNCCTNWLVRCVDDVFIETWRMDASDLPEEHLPKSDALLYSSEATAGAAAVDQSSTSSNSAP